MRPDRLAVLGLGAIGGSVAWQARLAGIPKVVGYTLARADGVQALKSAAVHDLADRPELAVERADLVVLATPPKAAASLMEQIRPALVPRALVTDVASLKVPITQRAVEVGLGDRFAGSHPFTGTHLSGWRGASPDRLRGVIVYVTPTGAGGEAAARQLMNFWEEVYGAHPVLIDAEAHDRQLAWTSHLPQAAASALAHALSAEPALRGASYGPGARDTTRLAASPAAMWVEILLMNRDPVVRALASLEGEVAALRRLIEAGDEQGLLAVLEQAARFRRRLDDSAAPIGASQRRASSGGET